MPDRPASLHPDPLRGPAAPSGLAEPQLGAALAELDPGTKALLDLSLRYGMTDAELADFLHCDPAEVRRRRENAVKRLGTAVGKRLPVHPPADGPAEPLGRRPAASERERPPTALERFLKGLAVLHLLMLLGAVLAYKAFFIEMLSVDGVLFAYGLVVCGYILTRFFLSLLYRPAKDRGYEPTVAIVMPSFNEEGAIGHSLRSLLAVDYPQEKLQIVAINDGSTDGTLAEIAAVADSDPRVHVISFFENRGKRAAMAAGIRATDAEIVTFVDSDSVLEPDALRRIVQPFTERKVGAVCGHADVLNLRESWLTRMQAVRYFVAFRVIKAAESIFSAVTCCSGCFSAYRREAILPRLEWWENQRFLGRHSTFGDDRSLTNCILRDWRVRYEQKAVSHTIVPSTFAQFMRQQLRWKRSWTRESLIVGRFIWRRKHPLAALATYISIVLTLVAPVVAVRAVVWQPLFGGAGVPLIYLSGVYAMALVYGLYYAISRERDQALWFYGVAFCFFYTACLLWQTYWAILTARNTAWGTRPATAGATG